MDKKTEKKESLKKFDLVIFNMSSYIEWQKGISNRNFHILNHLKNNPQINKILAIDYLPHTPKRALRNWKENIMKNNQNQTIKNDLLTCIYRPEEKITVYSTIKNIFSLKKCLREINNYLKKENFQNIILWSYYPLISEYFDEIDFDVSVFDAVDNWKEHASYKKFYSRLEKNYKIIRDRADLIFILSEESENIFYPRRENIFKITQGVDLHHYKNKDKLINNDIAKIPHPIIGYVGIIQENRVNLDLIEYIAKKNLDKSIVLIGPIWKEEDRKRLISYSNIYLLGPKKYEDVPNYIHEFDVGIIPHYTNEFIKYTCPMKIYEYLACGLPVVTTDTPGVEQFQELVQITNDFEKFNTLIKSELENDSAEKTESRLEKIKEHTWDKKVDQMMTYISNK